MKNGLPGFARGEYQLLLLIAPLALISPLIGGRQLGMFLGTSKANASGILFICLFLKHEVQVNKKCGLL